MTGSPCARRLGRRVLVVGALLGLMRRFRLRRCLLAFQALRRRCVEHHAVECHGLIGLSICGRNKYTEDKGGDCQMLHRRFLPLRWTFIRWEFTRLGKESCRKFGWPIN